MPPNAKPNALRHIVAKELGQFFQAPIAWLFLGAFLLVTLFIFFWVEAFFPRNIADARPMFNWMPVLLIFLSAALTMKMWSEERRSGTLEHVITQPIPLWQFVVGKFIACWALLMLALFLTLPLPITVSFLGDLDWGPVFSAYLAAGLLGAAYLSIGLFVSARCDNQIVSLILSVAVCGVFYMVGAPVLTQLVGTQMGDMMRQLGTGSRFESITRGVLDVRDFYYYLSLTLAFLAANIWILERGRWALDSHTKHHRIWTLTTVLVIGNLLMANFWLAKVPALRWDTTRGQMYSISDATRQYLSQLQEPILIRGYFSQKTHPLLAPLVPQLQDLLREYEMAGEGRVKFEIVDPTSNPQWEDEANNTYDIRATPFRVNDRHQTAVVNSYFDLLIKYGNEHQKLSFGELIEVKMQGESNVEVRLRNPEYDITRTIKKALYAYQSGGNLFATIKKPITLTAYVSPDSQLPPLLVDAKKAFLTEVEANQKKSEGKFIFKLIDPDANGGKEAQFIKLNYGFAPMAMGPDSQQSFYFYLVLSDGQQLVQMPTGDFSEGEIKKGLESGLKRFAQGFTRKVAIVNPMRFDPHSGQKKPGDLSYRGLQEYLKEDISIVSEDLSDGIIDTSVDVLLVPGPEIKQDKERFAIDQFLMRGGTVILATSPYYARVSNTRLSAASYATGIDGWLKSVGVKIGDQLVMDTQNIAMPVPVVRQQGEMRFQDVKMLEYPYFIDVRGEGLNQTSPITSGLPQVTVPWASPITLNDALTKDLTVTPLLYSSPKSWLGGPEGFMPSEQQTADGYTPGSPQQKQLLAVALQGKFTSAFAGQTSPIITEKALPSARPSETEPPDPTKSVSVVLEHSAESARLVVFATNDLFRDQVAGMLSAASNGPYVNGLQMLSNTLDWALQEQGLMGIRARGHFNRTLMPMDEGVQTFWEYLNYGLALLSLLILWLMVTMMHGARLKHFKRILAA